MGVLSTLRTFFTRREAKHLSDTDESEKALDHKMSVSDSQKSSVHTHDSLTKDLTNSIVKDVVSSTEGSIKHSSSSGSGYSFQYRDGRRYHADAEIAYVLPNDDDEVDRIHEQHWILRHALGGNFFAPVTEMLEKGITVLDSGCGPATWTFEIGESYPQSKVYGIDASCVFPEDIRPPNVEFIIGNIAKDLPYHNNTFDYIHQRLLILGLTGSDWDSTMKEQYRVLKPGGYIELAEPDVKELFDAGPAMHTLQQILYDMSTSRGMLPRVASELQDRLLKIGFVNPVIKITKIPLNHSGKIGQLLWCDYRKAYTNFRPAMANIKPEWQDPVVYGTHLDLCAEEAKESKSHLIWYSIYAQKPLEIATTE